MVLSRRSAIFAAMAFDSAPARRSASEEATVVYLDRVGVTYRGGAVGLQPTTLRFRAREFTVLLGLSGAGKSTLLRVVNHMVTPSAGVVTATAIGRLDSAAALRAHRRQTAMIFQSHQLIGRHTALQNVLVGRLGFRSSLRTLLPMPRADRCRALDCLERVGLFDKALVRADRLSGGQQQRVGIARALAQQPRLILADEPVASLDPATSERVMCTLRDICREDGIPCIVSLHQLELATAFADRIVGLAGGRIVFDDSPSRLTAEHLARIYGDAPKSLAAAPTPPAVANAFIPKKLEVVG